MDVTDHLDAVRHGKPSWQRFGRTPFGAGLAMMATPPIPCRIVAQDDMGACFTWTGHAIPELFGRFEARNGARLSPPFSTGAGRRRGVIRSRLIRRTVITGGDE